MLAAHISTTDSIIIFQTKFIFCESALFHPEKEFKTESKKPSGTRTAHQLNMLRTRCQTFERNDDQIELNDKLMGNTQDVGKCSSTTKLVYNKVKLWASTALEHTNVVNVDVCRSTSIMHHVTIMYQASCILHTVQRRQCPVNQCECK